MESEDSGVEPDLEEFGLRAVRLLLSPVTSRFKHSGDIIALVKKGQYKSREDPPCPQKCHKNVMKMMNCSN